MLMTPYPPTSMFQADKKLKEMERLAYLDTDKSLEAKEKGNNFFKQGEIQLPHCCLMAE